MSNLITLPGNLPAIQLDQSVLARAQSMLQAAVANMTSSGIPRLSFGGKMFNLTADGATVELQDRVLDVHIVAVNPRHHYVFYDRTYEGAEASADTAMMARYPLPEDEIEFKPFDGWVSRAYKQRAVVMLANDPSHKLYATDFGYNSIRKIGNPQLNLLNLSQLMQQFNVFNQQNQALLPFLFTVQLSFTKEVVPEVQFSLVDQRIPGNQQIRFADTAAAIAMQEALMSGEVDELMKIEFDTRSNAAPRAPAARPAPSTAQPQVQYVQQQPVQQPAQQQVQYVQQPVQQHVQQQPVQQQPVQQQAQQPAQQPIPQGGFTGLQML